MDGSFCDICFKNYCENKCIPKILECGHTICLDCLRKILLSQKTCPTCKTDFTKSDDESFPTNFALLTLSSAKQSNSDSSDMHLNYAFEELKRSFHLSKAKLTANIEERIILKNRISSDLARIQEILNFEINRMKKIEAELLINEFKMNLEKVQNVIHCRNSKEDIALNQHKNPKHFLFEISIKLHKNEKLFVAGKVDGHLKYGEITSEGDFIHVHSLSLSQVEENASLVLLEDLKRSATEQDFFTFLEILLDEKKKIYFKMVHSEPLSWQFLKLCTGESGPTYKGSSYKPVLHLPQTSQRPHRVQFGVILVKPSSPSQFASIDVANYLLNDEEAQGSLDYWFTDTHEKVDETKEENKEEKHMKLKGSVNGAFQIIISETNAIKTSSIELGFLHEPLTIDFNSCKESTISDCGFAFKIR